MEIIDATEEAMDNYGRLHGSEIIVLTEEYMNALKNGKILATNDCEYTTFIILEKTYRNNEIF